MKQDTKWRLRDSEGKEYIIINSEKVDMQEELNKMITKQMKEIERLNKRIEDLNIINEEHQILNGMIRKELQQKENIIKEIREYINNNQLVFEVSSKKQISDWFDMFYRELFEILNKVDKENI